MTLQLFRLVHFCDFIIRKNSLIPSEIMRRLRNDGKDGTREVWAWETMLLGQWEKHLARTLGWTFPQE